MEKNPYTLVFGKEPTQIISRAFQATEIIDKFCNESPTQQVFMITGVRGTGKTVFMTEISKKIKQKRDWIVVELNPERDLLKSLASKLSSEDGLAKIFQSAKINLSFFGFGLEVDGTVPITDIETALEKMLESLKKHSKKILITIDEGVNTPDMRAFASAFQIFVRQDLPVFLLMTGLYENINNLQNEKSLTFLYRAPKVELEPLNIGAISRNYKKTFDIDDASALRMAKMTRGYSFAFQVLGYFTWENGGQMEEILDDYRQYLEDYVYDKIWSELSKGDRRIVYGIARSGNGKISDIREILGIDTNQFNPYRKRLIKKGILTGDERGYVCFVLPVFEQFVLENYNE